MSFVSSHVTATVIAEADAWAAVDVPKGWAGRTYAGAWRRHPYPGRQKCYLSLAGACWAAEGQVAGAAAWQVLQVPRVHISLAVVLACQAGRKIQLAYMAHQHSSYHLEIRQ